MILTQREVNNMSEQTNSLGQFFTQLVIDFNFNELSLEGLSSNFHFIRPWWLLAFFALFIVLFLLKKIRYYQSPWQHFLPPHLAGALLESSQSQTNRNESKGGSSKNIYWLKPFIIGCCVIIALAGPAWQKLPQPVYQLERGGVLIMDMSYSMYATDVKPNRLTRARYKAIDLLKKIHEGDVGLIAYAGDAFIISPLTQDVKNIELLLPSLSPDIMPVSGANALAALTLAGKTLNNAGHVSGDIYWFTDDIDNEELSSVYDWAKNNNHKVNILGVGTKSGAPIKLNSGELLKDNRGAIVVPKLPVGKLSAIAQSSRGVYHTMTNNDSDIKALTAHLSVDLDDNINSDSSNEQESEELMQGDQYQEHGPWLLIIILPLLLSYFRRGTSILAIAWIMPMTLMFSLASISPNSYAALPNSEQATNTATNTAASTVTNSNSAPNAPPPSGATKFWQDLWQTSDQQAQQHYQAEDYQQAAEQFEDSQWQGSAHYKAGEYEQALQAFQQSDTAQSLYNQGNSLAQLQKIDEAIEAYKQALAKDPDLTDAKENLAQLEALKKQQEEQKQDSNDKSDEQSEEKSDEDKQEQGDKQDGEKGENGESQDQPQDGEQSPGENQEQSEEEKEQAAKDAQEAKDNEEQNNEESEEDKAAQAKESEEEQGEEKSLAQQISDKKAQETDQKHQQLLNKVTDDPYLLLRNKMRLEYQKRKNNSQPPGVTKQW